MSGMDENSLESILAKYERLRPAEDSKPSEDGRTQHQLLPPAGFAPTNAEINAKLEILTLTVKNLHAAVQSRDSRPTPDKRIEQRLEEVEKRLESHGSRLTLNENLVRLKEQDLSDSRASSTSLSDELVNRVSKCERISLTLERSLAAIPTNANIDSRSILEKISWLETESLQHARKNGALQQRIESSLQSLEPYNQHLRCLEHQLKALHVNNSDAVQHMDDRLQAVERRISDVIDMFRSIEEERRKQSQEERSSLVRLRRELEEWHRKHRSHYDKEAIDILQDEVRNIKRKFTKVIRTFNQRQEVDDQEE